MTQSVYWKLSSSRVVKGSRLASCACIGMRLCSCNVYTHARWLQPPVSPSSAVIYAGYT